MRAATVGWEYFMEIRRVWLAVAAIIASCALTAPAPAQDYPTRAIRILCNFAPGSSADVFVRFYADRLNAVLRQDVKVENLVKNSGTEATGAAAKAKPDGYTLLLTPANATLGAAPQLVKKLKWDAVDDFAAVTTIAKTAHVVLVNPRTPIKAISELTSYAKSRKDDAAFGASSETSLAAALLYNKLAGIESTRIASTVAQPLINDLYAGDADYIVLEVSAAADQVKAGKLRALAVTGATRSPLLPDVPTMEEAGVKGYGSIERWWTVIAPVKTPQPIIEKLETTFNRIVESDESNKFLANLRVESLPGDAKSAQAMLTAEVKRWEALGKLRGLELK
jgi:tripartite-type tricarboxylate transporter receptor subunit TctC